MFEGRDPAVTMRMEIIDVLAEDGVRFQQAAVEAIDVVANTVAVRPSERPDSPAYLVHYDKLVIALVAELALHDIEGFAEHGHTVTDAFHANRLLKYLEDEYSGGPIAIGSARFQQGLRGKPDWLPVALAACEGPAVEVSLSLVHWLSERNKGRSGNIDAAALTVPKLGVIGHQECDVVGRQIAKDVGALSAAEADVSWMPEVICIVEMGGGKGFYIHSNSWFGRDTQVLQMGHVPYARKIAYKELFFRNGGKVPNWGLPFSKWSAETFKF